MNVAKDVFVLFMPHWMENVLKREKLSYSTVFNLYELKKYCSMEDLAVLYWMNNKNAIFDDSWMIMEQYIWKTPQERSYIESNLFPMQSLAMDAINSRLNPHVNELGTPREDYIPFKLTTVVNEQPVLVVTQYEAINSDNKHLLVTEILKQLYAHEGYDNMANSQLFKGYLYRLAIVNNVL